MPTLAPECTLCPRCCKADRTHRAGFCGAANQLLCARAALHQWEEPCISGTHGSGTVFFSGCSLRCCYCQNHSVSTARIGRPLTAKQLAQVFLSLQQQGAHNLNLISPTPYLPWILEALDSLKGHLHIPIVYNTSGYERIETIQQLAPYVDIWLTDFKYVSTQLSTEYSQAADYFQIASQAVLQMCRQTGAPTFQNGLLQTGVIIRHLMLPQAYHDTTAVLTFLAHTLQPNAFLLSLMSQYTPTRQVASFPALSRRISTYEYRRATEYARSLGLVNGYFQERSSAQAQYTPAFDFTGLPPASPCQNGTSKSTHPI